MLSRSAAAGASAGVFGEGDSSRLVLASSLFELEPDLPNIAFAVSILFPDLFNFLPLLDLKSRAVQLKKCRVN